MRKKRAGIVTLLVAALQLTMRSSPPSSATGSAATATSSTDEAEDDDAAAEEEDGGGVGVSGTDALWIVLREPKLWCVYGSTALVTPTFDLTTLLPMYLDSLGMGGVAIGQLGSLFPLAAVRNLMLSVQCSALCCAALCYAVLCCAVLCCTALRITTAAYFCRPILVEALYRWHLN